MEAIDVSQGPLCLYLHFLCVCLLMWLQAVWLQAPKVVIIACVLLIKPVLPNILSSDPILLSKAPLLSGVRGLAYLVICISLSSEYLNIWWFKRPYTLTCDILFNPCNYCDDLILWCSSKTVTSISCPSMAFSLVLFGQLPLPFLTFRLTSWLMYMECF